MSNEIAEHVAEGHPPMVGTFNGNPVSMAAARATLTEVMTDDAYAHLDRLTERLRKGCEEVINRHEFAAHVVTLGAKGCVTFAPTPLVDYRDYVERVDFPVEELAWLYHMNNGIWMTPGVDEEWTLSVQHTEEDIDRYVDAFAKMAEDLAR
jgi:glutamate-1-semialdehyde 2,1-aminomutase